MILKEAIQAMLGGKQVTSDEFAEPDVTYCEYNAEQNTPFRYINDNDGDYSMLMRYASEIKTWRLRKYQPKPKELVWCWNNYVTATRTLRYFNKTGTYNHIGGLANVSWDNYAPYDGEIPEGMMKPEELPDE